jgi:hypothetical protein
MSREYGDTVRARTYPAVVADAGCSRRMHSDRTGETKRRTRDTGCPAPGDS